MAELQKLQTDKGMGVSHSKEVVKTGTWLEEWVEKHKAPKLAPATLTSYRNNLRLHIKPAIGEIALKDLSSYHIQRMLDGIGGSLSTFVKNYNIIHGALEKAVDLGMIVRNPCKGVTFPKEDADDMRVLTKEEQKALIDNLEGEYYRPMILTYLYVYRPANGRGHPSAME